MADGWNNFNSPDWDTPDFGTISRLRENIFVFSGAKTIQQLKEIGSLLTTEDGRVKSFSKFKADALGIWEKYNVNWLNAEYNHAIASAQMASRWSEFEKNKDINPNLTYRTAGDDRVRAAHQALDGVTKPINDAFWSSYYPPNDWGCRCDVDGSDAKVTKKDFAAPTLKPMFKGNVFKDGVIFPDTHPYFDDLAKDAIIAGKKVKDALMVEEYLKNAYKGKKGGKVDLHYLHKEDEIQPNMRVSKILADDGNRIKLLPHSNVGGVTNPDASINGKIADFKSPDPKSKNGVSNAIKRATEQNVKIVVFDYKTEPDWDIFCRQLKGKFNPGINNKIEECWIIKSDQIIKIKASEIWSGGHYKLLL